MNSESHPSDRPGVPAAIAGVIAVTLALPVLARWYAGRPALVPLDPETGPVEPVVPSRYYSRAPA